MSVKEETSSKAARSAVTWRTLASRNYEVQCSSLHQARATPRQSPSHYGKANKSPTLPGPLDGLALA